MTIKSTEPSEPATNPTIKSTTKVTTDPSEPTTNPTMKTPTQVTTKTTKTIATTTRKPTTPRKFEFGKIDKITTKTHDSDKAAMGKHGRLDISICGYVKFETLYCTVYIGSQNWEKIICIFYQICSDLL